MLNLLVGGKAGQGVNELAVLIGKAVSKLGYYAFIMRDYQSRIQGGHNFNPISINVRPVMSNPARFDLAVALDNETLEIHANEIKKDATVLNEKSLNSEKILKKHGLHEKTRNMIFFGAIAKTLGFDKEVCEKIVKREFRGKSLLEQDLQAFSLGYEQGKQKFSLAKAGKEKILMSGSEAVAFGMINSGLDVYFAYPMTPSTPVLHELASKQLEHNYVVFQPENEIAVANAALGASFAGARVAVGTSGGGFDLMAEALSMQGMNEMPLVVYLVQRTGPSTGVPTYTGQQDIYSALYSGHGEFPRCVLAPGDALECIELVWQAFYLAERYRILAILLSDKHLSESYYTLDKLPDIKPFPRQFSNTELNYKITASGISKRGVPGMNIVRANSYEHDEAGFTTEEPQAIARMMEKRARKGKALEREARKFTRVKTYGKGKRLIISFGSTKGAILDAMKKLIDVKFLQLLYLEPFPKEIVRREIEKASKVYVVENTSTGMFARLVEEKTGYEIKHKVLKYDARPFTPDEIIKRIR